MPRLPSQNDLAAFCRRWKIRELALFGSALREDFGPESDIDLLYTFESGANWGLFDLGVMERELCELLGRDVDFVSREAVEQSDNWYRRRHILSTARMLYAS